MSEHLEATMQKCAADMARLTLFSIPNHLEAARRAEDVLRKAASDAALQTVTLGVDQEDLMDTQSKLFTLTHHILGRFMHLKEGFQGMTDLWTSIEELRFALHRDLLRTQLKCNGCVNSFMHTDDKAPQDEDAKIEMVVQRLTRSAHARVSNPVVLTSDDNPDIVDLTSDTDPDFVDLTSDDNPEIVDSTSDDRSTNVRKKLRVS